MTRLNPNTLLTYTLIIAVLTFTAALVYATWFK